MQVVRQLPALRQLVPRHLGDQVLERPPIAEQAEVRQRPRREQTAQQVERLGPGRRLPGPVGLALFLRKPLPDRERHRLDKPAVGGEERVGGRLVVGMGELGSAVVEVPAIGAGAVEAHVTGRLLERRHADPAVLQRFGGQDGCLLDGDVSAGELGHRVVAVSHQDSLVELLGAAHRHHVVVGRRCPREAVEAGIGLVDELVEQHPPQALLGPRVAREQRALDHLGQVPQGEHRLVEVGEVPLQELVLGGVELGACHVRILPSPGGGDGPDCNILGPAGRQPQPIGPVVEVVPGLSPAVLKTGRETATADSH